MDTRSPSFEASLLYEAPGASDPAMLANDICEIIDAHGLTLRDTRAMDGIFMHFDCGALQLLLAYCADPLPPEHFLDVGRPAAAIADERVILNLLSRHSRHLTILVLDHPGSRCDLPPVGARAKRDLCWDITGYLASNTAPALVFWGGNDTLYTAPEFRRYRDFLAAQTPFTGVRTLQPHAHLREDPVLPPQATAWLRARDTPAVANEIAQPLAFAANSNRGRNSTALTEWPAQKRALRSVAVACCGATLGLSGMSGFAGIF